MNKEIEKYVGLYLLVYVTVLAVCGFFQYMAVCQGKSLACAFDMDGVNTIITTTAYVLTPIIAIIGFLSWKGQYNKNIESKHIESLLENLALLRHPINKYSDKIEKYFNNENSELLDINNEELNKYMKDFYEVNHKLNQYLVISQDCKFNQLNNDFYCLNINTHKILIIIKNTIENENENENENLKNNLRLFLNTSAKLTICGEKTNLNFCEIVVKCHENFIELHNYLLPRIKA